MLLQDLEDQLYDQSKELAQTQDDRDKYRSQRDAFKKLSLKLRGDIQVIARVRKQLDSDGHAATSALDAL